MTNAQIEKFLENNYLDKAPVKVSFKTRKPLVGIFIKTADYGELKSKNFWRIVGEVNIESYKKSKDMNLARMFNGSEITKLSAP
ncbi:short-chain dehydrogenase [Niastella caeni]|uniref:Short-chain dehydrogenase n=1 Tax=Niastella caeni TaxID=2569763 RepID=A0A4S8HCQ0_9BACT|nr:short-chain dehydrogenase [Niastella caeni]THU32525.1 short-chain dehydrogenase [Niastella caeni]